MKIFGIDDSTGGHELAELLADLETSLRMYASNPQYAAKHVSSPEDMYEKGLRLAAYVIPYIRESITDGNDQLLPLYNTVERMLDYDRHGRRGMAISQIEKSSTARGSFYTSLDNLVKQLVKSVDTEGVSVLKTSRKRSSESTSPRGTHRKKRDESAHTKDVVIDYLLSYADANGYTLRDYIAMLKTQDDYFDSLEYFQNIIKYIRDTYDEYGSSVNTDLKYNILSLEDEGFDIPVAMKLVRIIERYASDNSDSIDTLAEQFADVEISPLVDDIDSLLRQCMAASERGNADRELCDLLAYFIEERCRPVFLKNRIKYMKIYNMIETLGGRDNVEYSVKYIDECAVLLMMIRNVYSSETGGGVEIANESEFVADILHLVSEIDSITENKPGYDSEVEYESDDEDSLRHSKYIGVIDKTGEDDGVFIEKPYTLDDNNDEEEEESNEIEDEDIDMRIVDDAVSFLEKIHRFAKLVGEDYSFADRASSLLSVRNKRTKEYLSSVKSLALNAYYEIVGNE